MQEFFSKRSLVFLLISIFACLIGVTLLAPRLINWYATPFIPQGTLGVSCAPTIEWALQKMMWVQAISVGVGAFLGLMLALRFKKSPPQKPQL